MSKEIFDESGFSSGAGISAVSEKRKYLVNVDYHCSMLKQSRQLGDRDAWFIIESETMPELGIINKNNLEEYQGPLPPHECKRYYHSQACEDDIYCNSQDINKIKEYSGEKAIKLKAMPVLSSGQLEKKLVFLFDVDGVIVDSPHEISWKEAAIKKGFITRDYDFTKFYQNFVAGVSGILGAEAILRELGNMPAWKDEEKGERTAREFRRVKQSYLERHVKNGEFKVFDDIGRIILDSIAHGISVGAVSSSENAQQMLRRIDARQLAQRTGKRYISDASLLDVFSFWILGNESHNVKSKAQLYEIALSQVRNVFSKGECNVFVWEDADRGIEAAKEAGAFVIGVARKPLATRNSLLARGADIAYDEDILQNITFCQIEKDVSGILDRSKK